MFSGLFNSTAEIDNHDQQRQRWKPAKGGPPDSPICRRNLRACVAEDVDVVCCCSWNNHHQLLYLLTHLHALDFSVFLRLGWKGLRQR